MNSAHVFSHAHHRPTSPRTVANRSRPAGRDTRPAAAFRQRGLRSGLKVEDFSAPETWHAPREEGTVHFVVEPARRGFVHAVTKAEVKDRLAALPDCFLHELAVVQLSAMTRKRQMFPCYGMQWGGAVYLYPIEESLVETYHRPPTPQQRIEARMFGGQWSHDGRLWRLTWTDQTIKDFYLNNVLIHEIGHINDTRNTNTRDRERYANWFAIEYGYRATR